MIILLMTSLVFGQEDNNKNIKYQKQTEIDFEGLDITGELVKPTGSLIQLRTTATFNPLIRLRTDFDIEMSDSVNLIK